ncbi:MAG TPA: hypothetical protein VGU66_09670 [Candidatus Elarobacter sp.]|nr:hypothetical protein [Candidatus Elarobacter sp.]
MLLPHYSALKVAEQFRLLDALAPGRIDLGIGRAPGGSQRVSAALESREVVQFPHVLQSEYSDLHHLCVSANLAGPQQTPAQGPF